MIGRNAGPAVRSHEQNALQGTRTCQLGKLARHVGLCTSPCCSASCTPLFCRFPAVQSLDLGARRRVGDGALAALVGAQV